jgi:hypothetical protein
LRTYERRGLVLAPMYALSCESARTTVRQVVLDARLRPCAPPRHASSLVASTACVTLIDSVRHLSSRFSFVITTFELCTETFVEVPETFSLETPSTNKRCFWVSTSVTFPSMPAKSPRTILTVSPLRTGYERRPWLDRRSDESGADINILIL